MKLIDRLEETEDGNSSTCGSKEAGDRSRVTHVDSDLGWDLRLLNSGSSGLGRDLDGLGLDGDDGLGLDGDLDGLGVRLLLGDNGDGGVAALALPGSGGGDNGDVGGDLGDGADSDGDGDGLGDDLADGAVSDLLGALGDSVDLGGVDGADGELLGDGADSGGDGDGLSDDLANGALGHLRGAAGDGVDVGGIDGGGGELVSDGSIGGLGISLNSGGLAGDGGLGSGGDIGGLGGGLSVGLISSGGLLNSGGLNFGLGGLNFGLGGLTSIGGGSGGSGLSGDGDGVAELGAQVNAKGDGVLSGSIVSAVGTSALDEVVLHGRRVTEAVVHVRESAFQRRVLSDDVGEAVDGTHGDLGSGNASHGEESEGLHVDLL